MESFKLLGWKKGLLAILLGVLVVVLPQIYRMTVYYFPESQRGIYQAVNAETGETLVLDSRKAHAIQQIRVSDEDRELWIWYTDDRMVSKGKKGKMSWFGFKFSAEDKYCRYIWRYASGQNKFATLVNYDSETGKKLTEYKLVRENERN